MAVAGSGVLFLITLPSQGSSPLATGTFESGFELSTSYLMTRPGVAEVQAASSAYSWPVRASALTTLSVLWVFAV